MQRVELWVTVRRTRGTPELVTTVHWRTPSGIEHAELEGVVDLPQAAIWWGTTMKLKETESG